MRRRLWAVALLMILATGITACGSSAGRSKQEPAPGSAGRTTASNAAKPAAPMAAPAPAGPAEQKRDMAQGQSVPPVGPISSGSPQATDRKIIMNAEMEIKVKEADGVIAKISAAAKTSGGYVQDNRQQGTKQQGRSIQMTLRVPAGSYDSIVTLIAGLGEEVLSRREWTDDVTAEYLDLDARIKTQEVHLDQLQKLYSKGGTIKEMMELEQEIARVTSDIESMKGRFRFLTHQVDFSTITVRLYEPGSATPIKPPKTVMERVNLEFTNSWHGAVNFTGNAVVFLAGAVPVLVYLAIVGGVAYLVLRYARRFFRRPPQG